MLNNEGINFLTIMKIEINKQYLLKKFPGKGGWTYAEIPEIKSKRKSPFGWVKVKGFIEDVEINHYKLMQKLS